MSDNPLVLQYSDGNLVPYQTPDPAQAAQRALDFTGIPDIASGVNALARGEWLPGLGQAAAGASAMLPLGKLGGAAKLGAELMPLGGLIKAWHGTPHLFEPVPARAVEESGITAYHATPAGFDGDFQAGTHFGTLDAAHERLQEILKTPNESRFSYHSRVGEETPAVYRVKLKPKKILDVPDLEDFSDSDISSHLYEKNIITGNEFGAIQNGEISATDILRQKGYDALRYKNNYEDEGSVSHMVLDPSIISPTHRIEPGNPFGEFRDAAIGTGDGTQAYGHGHYVAENPAVAEDYQRNLQAAPELAGLPLQNLYRFGGSAEDKAHNRAINAVLDSWKSGGSLDDAHKSLLDGAAEWGNGMGHQTAADILKGWIDSDAIKAGRAGSLLEVHILPDEHELLDWDRPLAEQAPGVKKVIDAIHAGNEDLRIKHSGPGVTGENFYRNLANQLWDKTLAGLGGGSEAASRLLHEAGIPGIKYLDQGSRSGRFQIRFDDGVKGPRFNSKEEAEKYVTNYDVVRHPANNYKISGIDELPSTSNYVIFDPKNLRIVGRNGQRLEPVEEDPFK